MANRRRYDDKFRAGAVVTLEAAGYPDQKGALIQVANHLRVPESTLRGWYSEEHNPVPAQLRAEKRRELNIELREVAYKLVRAMPDKIEDAALQQVATSLGIVIDKMQLLEGKPTWIGEIVGLLQEGKVTPEEVYDDLGPELAQELFESAGLSFAGIREAETESATADSEAAAG